MTVLSTFGLVVLAPLLLAPEVLPNAYGGAVLMAVAAADTLALAGLWKDRYVAAMVLVVCVTALLGWYVAPAPALAIPHLAGLSYGLLAMSSVARACTSRSRLTSVAGAVLLAGLLMLIVGLSATTVDSNKYLPQAWTGWLPELSLPLPGLRGHVHPNALGGAAVLVVPLALAVHGRALPRWLLPLGAAAALTGCTALLVAQGRTAWLAMLFTLAVWTPRVPDAKLRRMLWLTVGLGVMAFLAIGFDIAGAGEIGGDPGAALQTLRYRTDIWHAGFEQWTASPWLGIGFDAFRHAYGPKVWLPEGFDVAHAHNIVLQTALDLGVGGALAYLGLIGILLSRANRCASRSPLDPETRQIAAGAALSLLAVHAFGMFDAIALGTKVGLLQWLTAGLVLGATASERRSEGPDDRGVRQSSFVP